jgi:hypothetical protein
MSRFGQRLQHAAGGNLTGRLYLTPSSGSYSVGGQVVVQIREDSGATEVNAVQVNMAYPDSLLEYVSTSTAGGAFGLTLSSTGGAGAVNLSVGTLPPPITGDKLVATITFNVLAAGTAVLKFQSGSVVLTQAASNDVAGTKSGASFTLNSN